ncbi:hypothetical protein KJ835_04980, partial [Patescibacteria group bacterium]|nr:hypothetical protein [Patescibacteria group bacterium]
MQTKSFTRLKKLIAGATLALSIFTPTLPALAVDVPPEITSSYANPTSFDPSIGQKTYFYWYLAAPNANIEIDVYDGKKSQGGTKIRDLAGPSPWYSVPNPVAYDGKINGEALKAGTYHYYVMATNGAGSDEWEQSFTVTGTGTAGNGGSSSGSAPVIGTSVGIDTNDYASPNPFDPNTQTTTINYTLSQDATVYVTIKDPATSQTVETIYAQQTAGTRSQVWDGKNSSNQPFAEKVYNYEIYATNQYGNNTETGTVEVKYATQGGSAPVIGTSSGDDTNDYASPNPFDPNTQTTTINYTLSQDATVYVTIKDPATSQTVETLYAVQSAGARSQVWDGKNSSNQPFAEKVYNYEIYAANQSGNNTENGTVEIKYAGSSVTAPIIGSSTGIDSADYASPNPFNPNTQTTTIYYTLNTAVDTVTVNIKDNGTIIETISGGKNSGSNTAVWDGKNSSNQPFANKVYDYEIIATNAAGSNNETGTVEIQYSTTVTAPIIGTSSGNDSGDYASPNPFNPNTQTTTIYYTLNTAVDTVTVNIKDNGSIIETISGGKLTGNNTAVWDGKNSSNQPFANKTYDYEIIATNTAGSNTETGTVQVNTSTTGAPDVTDVYASPYSFIPSNGEQTALYFRISKDANVSVDIMDGSSLKVSVLSNANAYSGLNYVYWNGKNSGGSVLSSQVYTIRVTACDKSQTSACDTENGSVKVASSTGDDMNITEDFADPTPFNPDKENTRIYYTLNQQARVTVEILDDDNKVIRTLQTDIVQSSGANQLTWNGKDKSNDLVDDGDYSYKIKACDYYNSSDCDTGTGSIEVDFDLVREDNLIDDVDVQNEVFNPKKGEQASICFDIKEDST